MDSDVWGVVILSANEEWKALSLHFEGIARHNSPFGEYLFCQIQNKPLVILHGGWGKTAGAASAQYAIQRWQPKVVINLGTCGGFQGRVRRGEIILVEETWMYDIEERMADSWEALEAYHVRLNLDWLVQPYPQPVRRAALLSADRDLNPAEIPLLTEKFNGIAGDWESGAIAWVAQRNHTPCLILRGVTDLVDDCDGEAYGRWDVFAQATRNVMNNLWQHLPAWLLCCQLS
ncbi:nucleoside phosphorylase [Bellilinea caldifistulae]|uniref:Nucleoside phosphorylase domain-containing protein n=1 Tax=Bellilinea caldifistulae TaxID=360411 RepID=A0A0P6X2W9_9CHLR|nr:5'-methylthioadenosine/S-adenosylhomocysteine nucleosidase [Bellilinea caldifistulae]KPL77092.1 hypothetical protein AC812_03685 [Bellilinea caldifistulae]GAP10036.1 nucleoside phosphorylase [Bellilinea caldifistulae]